MNKTVLITNNSWNNWHHCSILLRARNSARYQDVLAAPELCIPVLSFFALWLTSRVLKSSSLHEDFDPKFVSRSILNRMNPFQEAAGIFMKIISTDTDSKIERFHLDHFIIFHLSNHRKRKCSDVTILNLPSSSPENQLWRVEIWNYCGELKSEIFHFSEQTQKFQKKKPLSWENLWHPD